ncbi:amino acid ABC transporter permease [Saccharothrix sp. AJ9571]|nr:amino acid ABC transporter permease [Saccharothrix sp. AJ9571]
MNVLFDEPGPQGRRRIRIATALAFLLGLGALAFALYQFGVNGQLDPAKWQPYGTWPMWKYLLNGLGGTLLAAGLVLVLAMPLGLLLALGRLSQHRWIRLPARTYIEVFRVVPALLMVFMMLFALPRYGLDLPTLWKLVVPLTLNRSAQLAGVFRAGILSLDAGQGEAAAALGLRPRQAMWHVILPQALRHVLPSLISQTVGTVKDTSLGYVLSFAEVITIGKQLASYNRYLVQTYLVVALIYFVVNFTLSRLGRWLERRERRVGHVAAPADPGIV